MCVCVHVDVGIQTVVYDYKGMNLQLLYFQTKLKYVLMQFSGHLFFPMQM